MSEQSDQKNTNSAFCSKCGQAKKINRTGTITQWISACRCDLDEIGTLSDSDTSLHICSTCGKRMNAGREGSFTQWIFRFDCCNCQNSAFATPVEPEAGVAQTTFDEEEELAEMSTAPMDFAATERYRPISLLGTGATGAVFLCNDLFLRKKVAVKCLRQARNEQVIAFQQEAKAVSRLNHPNIVRVLDFGASEIGKPYMVMEYINGGSLAQRIQDSGPLELDEAIHLALKICTALQHAHESGVLHRDVKSSNILLSTKEALLEPVLIDFGVARLKSEITEATLSSKDTVVGSPYYMAPDAVSGRTHDIRSDIYSMGCVLFEMLTGKTPFIGATALETLSMHASHKPSRLSETRRDVSFPDEIESIVTRCLEKDPDNRFQSMKELTAALSSAATISIPSTELTSLVSKKPKNGFLIATTASILLATVSFAVLYYFSSKPAELLSEASQKQRDHLSKPPYASEFEMSDLIDKTEEINTPIVPDRLTGDEYFKRGIEILERGFPNQAREAMSRAEKSGDPVLQQKAAIFAKVHLPKYEIDPKAVADNIHAYNLMYDSLEVSEDNYDQVPRLKSDPKATSAKNTWESMVVEYPKFEWPFLSLSLYYIRTGELKRAEQLTRQVLAFNPDCYDAWIFLSVIYEKRGQLEDAEKYVNTALMLDPGYPEARRLLAKFNHEHGMPINTTSAPAKRLR